MTLRVVLRPEALAELEEARAWYEERDLGLGEEFYRCVEAVVEGARRSPDQYPCVHGEVRRGLVRRFPYGVFYMVTDDTIVILAVFHASRDPAGWR